MPMRRLVVCLCATLMLYGATVAHAEYDNDAQNPKEYTNEDAQPLRIAAYILSPIGFALEWGVARPLHYIATEPFLATAFSNDLRKPEFHPPAIAELPLDDVGDEPRRPSAFASAVPGGSDTTTTTTTTTKTTTTTTTTRNATSPSAP